MGFLLNTDDNNQKILYNEKVTVDFDGSSGTFIYDHNLNYIPSARVWYEPVDGRWYPLSQLQLSDSSSISSLEILGAYLLTPTSLRVNITNFSLFATSVNIWVRIYLDD